jgi:hypothetical protein
MKSTNVEEIISYLTEEDKKLLYEFAKKLLQGEQYRGLREEINKRREEIKKGKVLTHEELWSEI